MKCHNNDTTCALLVNICHQAKDANHVLPRESRCPAQSPTGCPISYKAAAFNPFGPAYQQDPAATLKWARDEEPVFYSPELAYWVVTRYEDVKAVFRDNILFSPSIALEKITPAPPEAAEILKRYRLRHEPHHGR